MKSRLHELAVKYSSDKLYYHSYVPLYEGLFFDRNIYRLLEIGVGERGLMQPFLPEGVEYCHGSSLKMFRDYFPEAEIYGADIREDVLFQDERIHTMKADATKAEDITALMKWSGGEFDVIIEDASHLYSDQRVTVALLLPFMKSDSILIVEDCWLDNGQKLAAEFGGYLLAGQYGRDDHLVVIYR